MHRYIMQCFGLVPDTRLAGGSFYSVEGKPYCEKDYQSTLDKCTSCGQPILDRVGHFLSADLVWVGRGGGGWYIICKLQLKFSIVAWNNVVPTILLAHTAVAPPPLKRKLNPLERIRRIPFFRFASSQREWLSNVTSARF